jgi:iron complex outermembrane recepter protein
MKLIAAHMMTSALALMGALTLAPTSALAQSGAEEATRDEEIVVTAQRRDEKSLDVPISVTTLGSEQLATANVTQLSDTARLTPGLRFDTQGSAMQPTIRGVGTAITTSGGGPNVATYVDGFFQPNTYSSDLQLLRVKSIQVLKGPQGTLFGRNTTGGAILVTSTDPSTERSAEIRAQYGRFNALTLQAYATAGLGESVAFDIEGLYRRGDGYFFETLTKNNKVGKYENWSIRAGLKADLGENASIVLRYTHTENDDPTNQMVNLYVDDAGTAGFLSKVSPAGRAIYGKTSSQGLPLGYFFAPPGTFSTAPGQITKDARTGLNVKIDAVQATIKADLGFADLTSYSQFRTERTPYYGDLDATALPFFGLFVDIQDRTWSQELLLNSKSGGKLQWTAGLSYFQFKDCYCAVDASFGGAPFIRFGGSTTTTKSYAAFVDMTYELSEKFFITAGVRYSNDRVTDANFVTNPFTFSYQGPQGQTIPFTGAPGTRIPVADLKGDKVTPRFVLRYKPNDETSLYASYTKGYKAGILNVGGLSQQPIQPENIDAFEVGAKFDNRTFSFDVAAFYYDYKNLQVSSFQSGAAQIRNAASSEIYGLEAQFRYRLNSSFNIYGGAAYTRARYKSFANAPFYSWCDPAAAAGTALWCVPQSLGGFGPGAIVQASTDATGFQMQRSPEMTANLGASYSTGLGGGKASLSGNLYYTSSFFFDPEQQFKQPGYAQLALRAQWVDPSDRFTIAVFGDNVTNKRVLSQVLFTTLGTGAVWGAPATYGISLGAKF